MKLDKFDVVELKDGNRATIYDSEKRNEYNAEVINPYGITLGRKIITSDEISKIIHKKRFER